MKKKKSQLLRKPERLSFPKYEQEINWLSGLLDTYFVADKVIYDGLRQELKKGKVLACGRGCSNCCSTHTTIPIYPLELIGLYWYAIEKIKQPDRDQIQMQLKNFLSNNSSCPFLIHDRCGIHPMRPMACRFFNVFNQPCLENEDPFYTRRYDVYTPNELSKNKAIAKMLPFHGFADKAQQDNALKNNVLNDSVQNLHDIEWHKLAERM